MAYNFYNEEVSPANSPANTGDLFSKVDLASEYANCPDIEQAIGTAGATVINRYDPSQKSSPIKEEEFFSIVDKYMDVADYNTNRRLMSLNEAEQNTLLLSLTGKLYQMIVDKVDEVDYGDIPGTKGDITRLPKYHQMMECIQVLEGIFDQFKEDRKPIQVIENAIKYLEDDKSLYMSSFAGDISIGITIYNTMALACVSSLSYMIATCIEYIKDPSSKGMKIALNKTGIAKVKDHLLYENLVKFNDACRKGEIESAIRPLIKNKAQSFGIATALIWASIAVGTIALVMTSLTMIRDCVYFFYATRARVSKYFDIQADLLEMNANELKNNKDIATVDNKDLVVKRQLAIAKNFRKIADTIAIEANQAERKATNEIKKDSKEYKIDDVETDPEEAPTGGPLF